MSEDIEKPKVRGKVGQWFVDLWKKIIKFLNEQFTGIFEKGKIFYTLVFLGGAIIIAFLSFAQTNGGRIATNIITLTFTLGFLFLMVCSFIPKLADHLFDE